MSEDIKRQLKFLSVVVVLSGGFFAYNAFFGKEKDDGTQKNDPAASAKGDTVSISESPKLHKNETPHAKDLPTTSATKQPVAEKENVFILKNDSFRASFSDRHAGLEQFSVLGKRFVDDDGQPHQLVSTQKEAFYPMGLTLNGERIENSWRGQKTDAGIRFSTKVGELKITQSHAPGDKPYQIWTTTRIKNTSGHKQTIRVGYESFHYVSRDDEKTAGLIGRPSPHLSRGVCYAGDDIIREDRDDLDGPRLEKPIITRAKEAQYAGFENQYFAMVTAGHTPKPAGCSLGAVPVRVQGEEVGSLMRSTLVFGTVNVDAGASTSLKAITFFGPKDVDALRAAGHHLPAVIDLGWFDAIGAGLTTLLRTIQGYVGNWGFAIMLLTLVIRIILLPLTAKSFQSMAKMRLLKPKIDRINELYADDPQKKGAATMELWRKEKVNPVSGCLPTLLQMPIWFALYQSIYNNVELYHQPFILGWSDLSAPDPYYILPLLYGGLMFIQQRLMPMSMGDPMQQKIMMYVMPIGLTVFLLFLPLGLGIYMVTQSTLGLIQQRFIHWRLDQVSPSDGDDAPEANAAKMQENRKKTSALPKPSGAQK